MADDVGIPERNEEEVRRRREEREQQIQKLIAYFDASKDSEAKAAAILAVLTGLESQEDILEIRADEVESLNTEAEGIRNLVGGLRALDSRLRKLEHAPKTESPEIKALVEKVNEQGRTLSRISRYERTLKTLEALADGRVNRWFREHFGGGS